MVRRFALACCAGLILTAILTTSRTAADDDNREADDVDPEQALQAADEAIRRDPNSAQAYVARARLWVARRNYRERPAGF